MRYSPLIIYNAARLPLLYCLGLLHLLLHLVGQA